MLNKMTVEVLLECGLKFSAHWIIVHLRGSVAVDVLYGSINNHFLHDEIQYSTDEKVADCHDKDNCPRRNRKWSLREKRY